MLPAKLALTRSDTGMPPEVNKKIDEILTLVNRMSMNKEEKLKLAQHLINQHITTNPEEEYKEEPTEKKEEE